MQTLTRDNLMGLEQYAKARPTFRAEVMAHKRDRQVAIGPYATLYFEDRLTMQYQVQEMLRIERVFEAEGIEDELAAYNPLIPDGNNWKATFMVEIGDIEERRVALMRMVGIEHRVWVQVAGNERVYAIADEDLERATEDKTSSVHFLRFDLTPAMVAAAKQGAAIGMASNTRFTATASTPCRRTCAARWPTTWPETGAGVHEPDARNPGSAAARAKPVEPGESVLRLVGHGPERGRHRRGPPCRCAAARAVLFSTRVFVSPLRRSTHTLEIVLAELNQGELPVIADWHLNERHYGALQGLNKAETATRYGAAQFQRWRRGYDDRPPALDLDDPRHPRFDARYANVPPECLPATESLADTERRVVPYWQQAIAPRVVAGEHVLVVTHGNTLRALIRYLDGLSVEAVEKLEVPTGQPLVYEFDAGLRSLRSYYLSPGPGQLPTVTS
jgi:bisphosphoglycerate-dependent phosphoglycerate mutase family 1